MTMMECAAGALGMMIGSFLNVCILRLPKNESIAFPGSHCMACNKPIAWYDNIPVLSYILLRGKCRGCQKKFSIQYPIIEALTGVLFVVFLKKYGLTPVGGVYLVFSLALLVQSLIDARYQIIPDEITLPGMVIGLVASLAFPALHGQTAHGAGLLKSFIGLLVGGGSLWAAGAIAEKILKKEAMGGGDVKLLALIGSVLGAQAVLWTIFVSSVIGSIVGIYMRIRRGDELIPFGPYLALAAFMYLFVGPQWIAAYMHLLGRV